MASSTSIIPRERIEQKIYLLRGEKVMLSTGLARLYQVAPRALVQAVKKNSARFREDFMFQLSLAEFRNLKITTCDFKLGWHTKSTAVCLYGPRSRHALKRAAQQEGCASQY